MALRSPHRDWRLDLISPVNVRAISLDQLLTRLWLRVMFENKLPLVARANAPQTIQELAHLIERPGNVRFVGFDHAAGAAETWLRADLVKTLRRTPDKFTVSRPVHALATRVRNDKESDDSNGSLAVLAWLQHANRGFIGELRAFIEVDLQDESVNLATFALALLAEEEEEDTPRRDVPAAVPRPLCLRHAQTYADDLRRLLVYADAMPRSALIDHIKRLTGFHLGLYLLRVFRIVTEVEASRGESPSCEACLSGKRPRHKDCPHKLELLVDFGEDARSPMARLAEESWALQEDRLARYVRSHLALKKLHEFAVEESRLRSDEALPHDTLLEVAAVETVSRPERRDNFFDERLRQLRSAAENEDAKLRLEELERDYRAAGLSSFRTYVAVLAHFSERRWVNYHRYLIDSLFAKNTVDGILRQPLGGKRRRRAAMGASLLETLTLIAVVSGEPGDFFTTPLRVDQLVQRLERRYDILITTPPTEWTENLEVLRTLAVNGERFKARLRETGLFTDLSDAFLAQLVRPRLHIGNR